MNEAALAFLVAGVVLVLVAAASGPISASLPWLDVDGTLPQAIDRARWPLGILGALLIGGAGLIVALDVGADDSTDDAGRRVSVKEDTSAYNGPSTAGYGVQQRIAAGESVRLTCSAIGLPSEASGNRLWYATDAGWLNDHFLLTGSTEPLVDECTGTTDAPREGSSRPNRSSGPYAVFTDEDVVPVREGPSLDERQVASLRNYEFVRLQCSVATDAMVPAPRALGPGASNGDWNKIVRPAGWVPDSFVATYSRRSVAPPCP